MGFANNNGASLVVLVVTTAIKWEATHRRREGIVGKHKVIEKGETYKEGVAFETLVLGHARDSYLYLRFIKKVVVDNEKLWWLMMDNNKVDQR